MKSSQLDSENEQKEAYEAGTAENARIASERGDMLYNKGTICCFDNYNDFFGLYCNMGHIWVQIENT